MENHRKTGTEYERKAGDFLMGQGLSILQYNYRCPLGEIDIVAKDHEYYVFCEVKYRKNKGKGDPREAVTLRKQRTISKCAQYYLMMKNLGDVCVRFDVIGITGGSAKEELVWIQNAFDYMPQG